MLGFMDPDSEESLAPNAGATLPEASARAAEAWALLQERGSSFGEHPLNDLLDSAGQDVDGQRSDVA